MFDVDLLKYEWLIHPQVPFLPFLLAFSFEFNPDFRSRVNRLAFHLLMHSDCLTGFLGNQLVELAGVIL